ncbi:cutinase family protein [Spirillospora sp. NPDC047279]|uniref:cutinase family protein n=1 Tax=Spirillospora sp. NPDC047279 TaxID=3155478 RepID=UPI0033E256F5
MKLTRQVPRTIGEHRRKVVAATIAAVTAATGVVVVVQAPGLSVDAVSTAGATGCTPVKLVVAPGTWETTPGADPSNPPGPQMLRAVTDRLQGQFGSRISSYWVPYNATAFDQGVTYADSKQTGLDATRKAMAEISKECPGTRFVGLGYSQGADVIGDVSVGIGQGRGPVPASSYIAGGLAADPGKGTPGEVNLGRQVPKSQGITGGREQGYGALSGKVANVCLTGDLYCALPQNHRLMAALGAVLGKAGVANLQGSAEDEVSRPADLSKPPRRADISALPAGVQKLVEQARRKDTAGAQKSAADLGKAVQPLQNLVRTVANPLLVNALLATPPGSQTHIAGQALQLLSRIDFVALLNDLQTAATAAAKGDVTTLMRVATGAAFKLGPLAGLPADQLAKASWVVQGLMPENLLAQANNIVGGVTRIDYAGIQKAARQVPVLARKGDVAGLYKVLTAIEDRLMPLATTADNVDFKAIGALLAMWPPGSQERAVGHALVLLDRVDWVRIVRDLRILQDNLAKFDPKNPPKINPADPAKSLTNIFGVNVLGLVPVVTDLAEHGLDVAGLRLPNGTLRQLLTSDLTPKQVVREGIAVATFYGSNVHTAYGSAPVDATGRPAVAVLSDWLAERIRAA